MYRRFVVLVCSAVMLGLATMPVAAQQKTARQCNDEWTANKATIQASGKTKKVFVAECRGQPTSAATGAPKPATTAAPKRATNAAPSPAANVKTAKQCNDEWTANKAAIQASKKTRKDFIAECRTQPAGAPTTAAAPAPAAAPTKPPPTAATPAPATPPAAAPARPPATAAAPAAMPPPATTRAAAGQFSTEAQAKARCPGDTVVWVNLSLGTVGNTIAGAIGGGLGGQLLQALIPALAGAAGGGLDLGSIVGQAIGGGASGVILTAIVGLIKNKMA